MRRIIKACASSSPVFLMMYSAYKLYKQGDNIQPWHTPFPIWNKYVVPCPVLTVASWTAYRFLKRQLQNHCRWWLQPWNQKTLAPWKKSYDQPRQHIKKQRHYLANEGPSSQSYGFSSGLAGAAAAACIDVRVGLWRKLSTEELMLLNYGVGEDSWESLGLQRDPAK